MIEQDHRHVKRHFVKSVGFQNFRYVSRTIKGIEMIQVIYKQRRNFQIDFAFLISNKLQKLVAAV